ncbi:Uncharacterised protein [Mycobacterium tuberculosis]|nr:Uncharacterised protein [Mycobacterium tuberculosis]
MHRFINVRDAIAHGDLDPSRIAVSIQMFTPGTQLARVFRYHQEIQNTRGLIINPLSH